MKKLIVLPLLLLCLCMQAKQKKQATPLWPDGTEIGAWFNATTSVDLASLGRRYVVTDYGVKAGSSDVQTRELQAVIDRCAKDGGGQVVIPAGTFFSGSLYFRQGTHLVVEEGGMLKGSDRVEDFDIKETRIEGETCKYYTALVNADSVDGFTIAGPGTIDGNGYHYWKQFWMRREWNRQCTNKDEQRPRLVYISNSKNVTVQDVKLQNSPFWTNHVYKSDHVRFLRCYIYSSTSGVKGPSTDAIDLDVVHDVLVHNCYMNVNDDAIAMKGGKGTFADKDPNNGGNRDVIIQNCTYGKVHGCLTLGSESLENHNIILKNIKVGQAQRVLWLKMRPDTPQHYEYVTVDNIEGYAQMFLVVRPWTQFYNKVERADMPLSQCNNIVIKNIKMRNKNFFDVGASDKYALKDFTFENIDVEDEKQAFTTDIIENTVVKNVSFNGTKQTDTKSGK